MDRNKRVAIIIGAGPAELTAALELARQGDIVPAGRGHAAHRAVPDPDSCHRGVEAHLPAMLLQLLNQAVDQALDAPRGIPVVLHPHVPEAREEHEQIIIVHV